MPCNLNFNQCNTGCIYPRPIFTCRRDLIALLNQSDNIIVNPIVQPAQLIANITGAQTVLSGGNVVPVVAFNQGSAISYDNAGTFSLVNGRYMLSFNLNGTFAADGNSSFAVYVDGVLLPNSSVTSSGTAGSASTVSNSIFLEITNPNALVTIRNTNVNSQTISSGNVVIQKII